MRRNVYIVEERNAMLARNYDAMNEYYATNAKLYHDMKHHLKVLNHMLNEDNVENAKEYLESINETAMHYTRKKYTGIDIIDIVLTEKEKIATEKEIAFITDTQILPQKINIEKKDICSVVANLLDNAVDAASKEIKVKIAMMQSMLFINVENDYTIKPIKINGYYQTTKKDKINHGLGLRNVELVVQKYEGIIDYSDENQKFKVSIYLNN